MAATERTPLTRPTDSPNYVEFSNVLRTRNSRVRHFQCCVCATLLAIFMMALVVTVSYSVNHAIDDVNVTSLASGTPNLLKSIWTLPPSDVNDENKVITELTDSEWQNGILAGHEAIKQRKVADAEATPLKNPSPNSRHQFAVSTTVFAGHLALAGLAELAASHTIESGRISGGKESSIGAYFDGGWSPDGKCKEFSSFLCTINKYRTFDGTCNHKRQWGSAFTPFRRSLPPEYGDGLNSPREGKFGRKLPSAREVSLRVHPPSPSSNPSFTVMLAVFGQFFDHDITATAISQGTNGSSLACCPPASGHPECFPVRIGPGDPVYDYTGSTCMEFVRSAPAPQCKIGPREQLNQVSAFIDGSAVYGATESAAKDLREGVGGRLQMQITADNRTLLPPSRNPNDGCNRVLENLRGRYCFASGDARANENLHLTTMHLLWARQHNRIADTLAGINPHWDDERLYQESRRVLSAQLQHITYNEFLPIIIGENATVSHNLRPLTSGYRKDYNPKVNPAIANEFAAAAFRFAHTLLPGLMRMTDAAKGTSSYVELHKMLFNPYSLYMSDGVRDVVTSTTTNVIQKTSTHVTSQLTRHMFEDPVGNTSVPCGLDLVSLNIQRGRDHGLKGYPAWREYCGLSRPAEFSDLEYDLDPDALDEISMVYASVDDIDLYTGALAEIPKADGLLGPTFTCLITDQFVKLQRGDRYWYETDEAPQAFTKAQLKEIRKFSLAKLICDCSNGVKQIQAEVMRAAGPNNPTLSCEDMPGPSLDKWKERNTPVLQLKPGASDWVDLKNNINETIQEFIKEINASKLLRPVENWINLHNFIKKTFIDIRKEIARLNLSSIEENISEENSEDVKTYDDVRNFVFESLAHTNDHILGLQDDSTISNDWTKFKSEINQSLNSAIRYFRNSVFIPADTNWLVFEETIRDQFEQIKYQLLYLRQRMISEMMNNTSVDQKEGIVSKGMMSSTENENSNESLDNYLKDIAAFKSFVNKSLAMIEEGIDDLQPTPAREEIQTMSIDWLDFKSKISKALSDAIKSNKANEPAFENSTWVVFRNEMIEHLTDIKMQIASVKVTDRIKFSKNTKTNFSEFNSSKRENRIDKLSLVSNEKVKVEDDIGKTFSDIKKNIADLDMKSSIPMIPLMDWVTFKSEINNSITDFIVAIKGGSYEEWKNLRSFANNSFEQIKKDISAITANNPTSSAQLITHKNEYTYKENNQLTDSKISPELVTAANISDIELKSNFARWTSYKQYIRKCLTELQNLVDAKKRSVLGSSASILTADYLFLNFYVLSTIIATMNQIP